MDRLFSGMTPSGTIHLGNYLGALRPWLALQDHYESFFCITDLHAVTTPWSPGQLRRATLDVARTYLAAGLDPAKCTIFVQSHVPSHLELCWVLAALTTIPQLERMTQYKEKGREGKRERPSAALLNYPVLMAADILLYHTRVVPVGEDQKQHLELVKVLALRFNREFGDLFTIPEPLVPARGARIMALDDPRKKMSKTGHGESAIGLTDTPEVVREKVRKAVTDPGREIVERPDKPAISNLLSLYTLITGKTVAQAEEMYRGKGYADFKEDLAEVIIDFLAPFQERYYAVSEDRLREVLKQGAARASLIGAKTMGAVKEKTGFWPLP